MKFTELDFMMGDPGKVPSFGTGPSGSTQNSFVFNNSSRQIDDASLGYLVEYMELDEFLDECDLRLDTNITETVTELDIDGFLSKNDQLPFEVVQPSNQQQVEAQNPPGQEYNNKRRRVSSASTSNSNSSHGSTSEQLNTPTSSSSPNPIKTEIEVDGISGICSTGEQIFPFPQQIHTTQQQQTTNTLPRNATSQIILPQAPTYLAPQQNDKKQQENWLSSMAGQSQAGPSNTSKPRKKQSQRQKKLDASDNISVAPSAIPLKQPQPKSGILLVPPANPQGSAAPLVEVDPNGVATPAEPNFVIPSSPDVGKNKRKRKQSISDNMKDEKYWERRRKNNAAAKRSREERLAKEASVAKQANTLVLENQKLTEDLKNALDENKKLRLRLKKYEPNFSP